MRAVSGCVRISEEIDVSVLNRKCGLIWFASASIFAASSSFSCSCSRCSIRALFQILIGVATQSVDANRTISMRHEPGALAETRRATGAEAIAAATPGCAIQIAAYLDTPIPHPMTLLDHAMRGS